MNPRDFLAVAEDLLEAVREADWRTAVSRAYYAAFLLATEVLREAGFAVPQDGNAHTHVYLRLSNCGRAEVVTAAQRLWHLREARNWAENNMTVPLELAVALDAVADARRAVRLLDDLAGSEAVLALVVAAMRVYERDVLKQVTFREAEASE
jgi:hypothetical protein